MMRTALVAVILIVSLYAIIQSLYAIAGDIALVGC